MALVDAQSARGVAHVSMTGGSMGSQIIASLCAVPARDAVDWSQVHVWWGDERWLPAGDADRNDTQNDAAGLDTLGLDPANVHRVLGPDRSASAEESAQAYSDALHASRRRPVRRHGARGRPRRPRRLALPEPPDGVARSAPPPWPCTTPPSRRRPGCRSPGSASSARARCGSSSAAADKADAVRRGVTGAPFETTPAAHVHGVERTLWLVDTDAAADLER